MAFVGGGFVIGQAPNPKGPYKDYPVATADQLKQLYENYPQYQRFINPPAEAAKPGSLAAIFAPGASVPTPTAKAPKK